MREIGGRSIAGYSGCVKCHSDTGLADPIESVALSRGAEWVAGHVTDPEMIAPGLREPPASRSEREVAAILAYVRRVSRQPYRGYPADAEVAATVWAHCSASVATESTATAARTVRSSRTPKPSAPTLRTSMVDPEAIKPDADMPSFGKRLSPEQLDAIAGYLASRAPPSGQVRAAGRLANRLGTGEVCVEIDTTCVGGIDPADEAASLAHRPRAAGRAR